MRSIVRRDTGEGYQEFLTKLARESGIETPTREYLAKLDKKRKNKASNNDWENPHDPDAKIPNMKDGRTHKAEHAVDMDSDAILGVMLQGAYLGDTTTVMETINVATATLAAVADDPQTADAIHPQFMSEAVLDKGHHANETMVDVPAMGVRPYASEPDGGQSDWDKKAEAQQAVYANQGRMQGERGKRLLRGRGETAERSFAYAYETVGMRRTHLRGHGNILKRLLVHTGGFNLQLALRKRMGRPRALQGLFLPFFGWLRSGTS